VVGALHRELWEVYVGRSGLGFVGSGFAGFGFVGLWVCRFVGL
jgi:hypothetical protein